MNNPSEYAKIIENDKKPLISEAEIKERVRELGRMITRDYQDVKPTLIGVLNGSFIFFADLVREIQLDLEIDFIKLSSYGDAKISSGKVDVIKEINADLKGRHVIIVEDIIDTGLSIMYMKNKMLEHNPASLRFVSLLYKKDNVNLDFDIDYVGFYIPNEFVVGYGLDYKQVLRNLPAVYVME